MTQESLGTSSTTGRSVSLNPMATVAGMRVLHGFSDMDSAKLIWLKQLVYLPIGTVNSEPLIWQHSPGDQPGGRVIILNCFYDRRGNALFSLEWTLTLDMDLTSLSTLLLPKPWIHQGP